MIEKDDFDLIKDQQECSQSRGRESRSGTQTSEESTSAIHRRAISDQSGFNDLDSQRVPFRDSRPASIRSAEGRCQSQVVLPETTNDLLNQQSNGNGIPQLDRKQSNSTPSLAEEDLNGEDATG
ncbi:hypothetical protein WR25_13388 [Diploscapter pachys]|uniref:Uncharacterized protein n=1 Tax=Diploscapter pachys TaxID=2018661 RepID=A0A2A2J3B0_9BILA|nr:hypothetical protein WR25_13388 [Diploscapter pachys]